MKFSVIPVYIVALAAYAQAISTTFDSIYDNPNVPLSAIECSGSNVITTKRFNTFGDIPTFPNIGGAPVITMFNDPDCGSCWNLSFTGSNGATRSVMITAIDGSTPNFNIGETAMNELTGNQAELLGIVPITAVRLASSACGL